jgi:hypothetical protein
VTEGVLNQGGVAQGAKRRYAVKETIMPNLELATEEALLLKEILESDLGDLRMERADTDLQSFRDKLRSNEELIKRIIDRLAKMYPAAEY